MSDLISKSTLLEMLKCYEIELHKDRKEAIETDDEMMLFAIENQETAISRIKRSVLYELSTVDEKEIIRKPMERIVERLEEQRNCSDYGTCNHCQNRWCPLELLDADEAIKIVKEEGGVNVQD